jgi:hypothetical protein
MLDRLPAQYRHLILMVLVPLLGYVAAQVVPALDIHPLLAGAIGVVLTEVLAWLTPLTRQYGVGSKVPESP